MTPNRMVLDLSHWNDVHDWRAVRRDGNIVGVILKATEGKSVVDETFAQRVLEARQAGLLVGAYHYLHPAADMLEQAEHFVRVAAHPVSLSRHVLDPQILLAADHEERDVSLDELKTFMAHVEELAERDCVLYSGHVIKEQLGDRIDLWLAKRRLWLAHYSDKPTWPRTWSTPWLWQYTDQDTCPGIYGNVDANSYEGTTDELAAEWSHMGELQPAPEPAPQPEQTITIGITVPAGMHVIINTTEI